VKISGFSIQKLMVTQDKNLSTQQRCVCAAVVKNFEKLQDCFYLNF